VVIITATVITKTGINIHKSPFWDFFSFCSTNENFQLGTILNKNAMERFNKEIKVGKENKRFQFTKIHNIDGVKFFITTVDGNEKPISFSMKKNKDGDWALTPGSLRWLYDIRAELADAINEAQPA
jgi:hypothetical protein